MQQGACTQEGMFPCITCFPSSQVGWESMCWDPEKLNELVILDIMNWFLYICRSCCCHCQVQQIHNQRITICDIFVVGEIHIP